MRKFAVFGGFLGAGKTTAMMALTRFYSERFAPAAMISNDLGEGVDLADDRYARLSGCRASQIVGECICFCHDVLRERLDALFDEGCELVVSDIPGFGVGALEHVYRGLEEECPNGYELAPFTVLTEPRNVEILRTKRGELRSILDAQLREADLIVLNKCDTVSPENAEADRTYLSESYPEAQVIAISALDGTGIEELARALREKTASPRHPDINYDDDRLQSEMSGLSEYYLQYHAEICCYDFNGNAYLADMAEFVREEVLARGYTIPHFKLLAWGPEGDFGKADLTGTDRPASLTRRFEKPCKDLAVILNATAACPKEELDEIISKAAETVSERYMLERMIYKKECFGMGD